MTPDKVFEAMQVYLGSAYINDFNYLGRTYEVTAQADAKFRSDPSDIARLKTRNASGQMVPIGSVARLFNTTGPYRVPRYDLFPAAEVQGSTLPGVSSGYALTAMEKLAAQRLPAGIGYEWTDLAYQQRAAGDTALMIFAASVLFVFLVLAAQYESWTLPLSVVLIVPMCLLAAVDRAADPRSGRRYPGADRLRRAGWAGGEKRHPDRRVRPAGRGNRGQRRDRRRSRRPAPGCARS